MRSPWKGSEPLLFPLYIDFRLQLKLETTFHCEIDRFTHLSIVQKYQPRVDDKRGSIVYIEFIAMLVQLGCEA